MTMQRVTVRAFGGPEQLAVEAVDECPRPGHRQILVDVEAAGVNYLDVYQRKGLSPISLPFTPGYEGVGRVREIGPDIACNSFTAGDRVAWINSPGSYASQVLIAAAEAIPVPKSFTVPDALLFQAITAEYLINEYRAIGHGDRVLVHAAAGGVGHLLVQWCKHLGAWVVGTTSSDAKALAVRAAGADAVINYGHDYAFLDALLSITDGKGVDLAFDAVGAATLANTVKALARGGTALSYGSASGTPPAIETRQLAPKCARLAAGALFTYIADPLELQRRAATVVEAIQAGWLRMGQGTAYALANVAQAHRDIEGRGTQGKLFLTPEQAPSQERLHDKNEHDKNSSTETQ